jgi:hypothetical protein
MNASHGHSPEAVHACQTVPLSSQAVVRRRTFHQGHENRLPEQYSDLLDEMP